MNAPDEIRIIKRKKADHGHHGGAWKVAYADFVTAMMAFFLVMWIIGLSQELKKAIAGYFRDPVGFMETYKEGKHAFSVNENSLPGKPESHHLFNFQAKGNAPTGEQQRQMFEKIKRELETALATLPDLARLREHIQISIAEEGLRIELIEGPEPVFFETGSAQITPAAKRLMILIAQEVRKLDNRLIIEGHTDSRPYRYVESYSNWELSADRANAARRVLESAGLWKGQVAEVRGYADTRLRVLSDPYHYSNRRVSLLIPYRK